MFNQMKQWVESEWEVLHLVHESNRGPIATFLYR